MIKWIDSNKTIYVLGFFLWALLIAAGQFLIIKFPHYTGIMASGCLGFIAYLAAKLYVDYMFMRVNEIKLFNEAKKRLLWKDAAIKKFFKEIQDETLPLEEVYVRFKKYNLDAEKECQEKQEEGKETLH